MTLGQPETIAPPPNYALKCGNPMEEQCCSENARMIERIGSEQDGLLAIIVRSGATENGVHFVTGNESVHQLGILQWPEGHIIDAHIHNPLERTIDSTQEVLFIRSGKVRVDLYTESQIYKCSSILEAGDVIFLSSGGHGFEILEEANIVEVKQGPYLGEQEKTRFVPEGNPHWEGNHGGE
jgi:mannose-6-phosphate isomerase-like protein (cupin superfamily)